MYVATLTYARALGGTALDEVSDRVEGLDGSVAVVPGVGLTVTLWVDDADLASAPRSVLDVAGQLIDEEPVGIEVWSPAEYERRAEEPTLPALVSAAEVAELLGGISRQRVHQLRALPDFPTPVLELRTGPIWSQAAVERFARDWSRKPGRPATTRSA